MAERQGFEPWIRFWRILTFQASAFDHSATAPHALEDVRPSGETRLAQAIVRRHTWSMLKLLFLAALLVPDSTLAAEAPPKQRSAPEIVKAAPAADWVSIAADDLLVMTLAPDSAGRARQVFIQLLPPPFSQGWIGNMKKLAAAHWWDGGAIYRVQDNWVAQFGDPEEDTPKAKPLPAGLAVVPESEYVQPVMEIADEALKTKIEQALLSQARLLIPEATPNTQARAHKYSHFVGMKLPPFRGDAYASMTLDWQGWPFAIEDGKIWPTHCYATIGVGRNNSPDTGTGAELYAVIGTPPRQLDRNIAVVGRVIEGIEHLSSLPRAPGNGMYNDAAKNTPILTIRRASELPASEQPRFQYLSTQSQSFADYVHARVNRRDSFYIYAAGGADICNIPVPIRRAP